LSHLNRADTKIITVEDPVEYRLDRITQVQVNPKIGLDFGRVLRTALRQDPDVLLVGEMRDRETVEIGLRGAMTGHLVFSTLHTINALATVNRLLDMGAAGYMIAAALHGVVAQRLVRRVCADCATEAAPSTNELAWLASCRPGFSPAQARFVAGSGCTYCNLTGFRGRVVIAESLEVTPEIGAALRRGASVEDLRALAVSQGMTTMAADGIRRAAAGETTLDEVLRTLRGL